MGRIVLILSLFALLFNTSCKRCMRCSYEYTVTTITQTPNGEVESTDTITGYVTDPETGLSYTEECERVKKDETFTFDIEKAYSIAADTLEDQLENFSYTCQEVN